MPNDPKDEFPKDPRDMHLMGFKSGAFEYFKGRLSLDKEFIPDPSATYFTWVKGDETRRIGLRNGDLLVVDCSLEPSHGDLVICVVRGRFRVRRIRLWGEHLVPVPLRRSEEIDPLEPVEVWGVVSGFFRPLRYDRSRRRK